MSIWMQLAILTPFIFLAGFVDSIAGGGGLISVPAFLMMGLPPIVASGTNKFAVSWGTLSSASQYVRGRCYNRSIIPVSVVCAIVGALAGAQIAMRLDQSVLRVVMIVLIPIIAVLTLMKKDFLDSAGRELPPRTLQLRTAAVILIISVYDGFFGPGTGTFLLLALVGILGLDTMTACGSGKIANVASNFTALIAYSLGGYVVFALAIPLGLVSILGNWLGARYAMKHGTRIIRPIMMVVVGLLLATLVKDLLGAAAEAMAPVA